MHGLAEWRKLENSLQTPQYFKQKVAGGEGSGNVEGLPKPGIRRGFGVTRKS